VKVKRFNVRKSMAFLLSAAICVCNINVGTVIAAEDGSGFLMVAHELTKDGVEAAVRVEETGPGAEPEDEAVEPASQSERSSGASTVYGFTTEIKRSWIVKWDPVIHWLLLLASVLETCYYMMSERKKRSKQKQDQD